MREILSTDGNSLDAETIQYTEPYRDTSKKDEIYRRKANKKAVKILTTNKKRKVNDERQDNFSDAETKKTKYIGKKQRKKR